MTKGSGILFLGMLAAAGGMVIFSGGNEQRREGVSRERSSSRKFMNAAFSSWIPSSAPLESAPRMPPESTLSIQWISTGETERPEERPKEMARTIRLAELPVSPQFLQRLEAEEQSPPPAVGTPALPPILPFSGRGGGSPANEEDPNALSPGSYRLEAFFPGKTGSGRSIDETPDIALLQDAVRFPPDYSLATAGPLKNRLLSLGNGGIVVLAVVGGELIDGPGADFAVFENPFVVNGTSGREVYAETAVVEVAEEDSDDSYRAFPCAREESPYRGCAGVVPVRYADGLPLTEVGGDRFDLADLGLSRVKFIRIRDTGDNRSYMEGTEGFDLDGIALLHTVKENP